MMVWGCFWWKNRGTLCPFVVKSVNASPRCTSICWSTLSIQPCNASTAPSATLYFSKIMLQCMLRLNGLNRVDEHPPYSPDLNPIEHVWVVLEQQLTNSIQISLAPGGPNSARARLVEVFPKVWDPLPEKFDNLYRSMPDRVAAVIDSKG